MDLFASYEEKKREVSTSLAGSIDNAMGVLSPRETEVVHAIVFEQLTVAETARKLGVKRASVRTYWERARLKLALQLGDVLQQRDESL